MKKLMMMAWTAAAVGLFAAPAKQTLVATAEIAPFADITPAVTALGTMMNNPLLPTLVVGMAQQGLTQNYGRFRSSSPLFLQVYFADDALKNLNLGAKDALKDKGDAVLVYPIDETEATFLQKPGATKAADGTIHLAKSETRAQEAWVKFSADGKFCAFAQSPALAALALEDFAKRPAPRPGAKSHLVRVGLREPGINALIGLLQQVNAMQETKLLAKDKDNRQYMEKVAAFGKLRDELQLKVLSGFSGAAVALDLDDYGISVNGVLRRKPGTVAPEAGESLPAGVLDQIPAGAGIFLAYNRLFNMGGSCSDASEFMKLRAGVVELLKGVSGMVTAEAAKNPDFKKFDGFFKELIDAAGEAVETLAYPKRGEWNSFALGFDAQKSPAFFGGSQASTAAAESAAACRFLDRVWGAVQRQWPEQKFLVKRAAGAYAIDWVALLDFVDAQNKPEKRAKPAKIAQAKNYIRGILGGTTTEFTISPDGQRTTMAAPGVKFATEAGEARFAAAIPEVAKARPAAALYLTPYAFARDVVIPTMLKFAEKAEERQQLQAMQAALPAASSKGALAGATWVRKDGTVRFLLRLTPDEVKSFGAAIGALSSSAAGDDDDDDADN